MKRVLGLTLLCWMLSLAGVQRAFGDSVIGRFVDSQTNAVIHVDFTSLDMDQVDAWQQKALQAIDDPTRRAQQQQQAQQQVASAKKWIADFKAAGGKDLYIVISLAGIMQGAPGGFVIPLNGADPAALQKAFNPRGNPPPADPNDPAGAQRARMQPQTAVVGDCIVFSTGAGIDKMKTPSTEARQDLSDALASGNGSTCQVAFNPATLKGNPLFAAIINANTGGGSQQPPFSDPQWDNVSWMSVSLNAPPKESGNCTIQCKDAGSAGALSDLLNKKIEDARNDPKQRGNMSADDFNKVLTAVKPSVNGAQVVIALDQTAVDNVIGPLISRSAAQVPAAAGPAAPPPPPADGGGM